MKSNNFFVESFLIGTSLVIHLAMMFLNRKNSWSFRDKNRKINFIFHFILNKLNFFYNCIIFLNSSKNLIKRI